jgi:hypothetical protein
MQKNFFKNKNERLLWIKLNAERIQYENKVRNNQDNELGDIDTQFSYMNISKNQLTYDENECDAPRYSFEELFLLTPKELLKLSEERTNIRFEEKTRKFLKDRI